MPEIAVILHQNIILYNICEKKYHITVKQWKQ